MSKTVRKCTLAVLLCLLACSASAGDQGKTADKQLLFVQQPRTVAPRREKQLLVSLANGNLVALDQDTGETLWTFETGMPLVSSTPPSTSGSETDEFEAGEAAGESGEGAAASRLKDSIFPGTDGSLYAYRPGQEGAPPRIEKLPVTVSELVNESPAPTLDGSIVLGSQHTTVFLIDGASGQLIKTFYDFDGELAQLRTMGAAALGLPDDSLFDLANAVVIGRKDYVVRSVHPEFGEQWNVTWSRVQRLSELEVLSASARASLTGAPAAAASAVAGGTPAEATGSQRGDVEAAVTGLESTAASVNSPVPVAAPVGAPAAAGAAGKETEAVGLVVGPDFALRRFDPSSGWERWSHSFDAVPIAAYSSSGGRLDLLDPVQRQKHLESAGSIGDTTGGASRDGSAGAGGTAGGKAGGGGLPLPKFLAQAWQRPGAALGASASPASQRQQQRPAGGDLRGEDVTAVAVGAAGMCATGGPDEVLVTLMGGSLFGIPGSHLTFDVSQQQCHTVTDLESGSAASVMAAAAAAVAEPPALLPAEEADGGSASLSEDASGTRAAAPAAPPSTAVALPRPQDGSKSAGEGLGGDESEGRCQVDDPTAKCSVPLGMYKVAKPGSLPGGRAGLMLLPASANESGERTPRREAEEVAALPPAGTSQGWTWPVALLLGATGGSLLVLILWRRSWGDPPLTKGAAGPWAHSQADVQLSVFQEQQQPLLAGGRSTGSSGGEEVQAGAGSGSGRGDDSSLEGAEAVRTKAGRKKNGAALRGKHLSNRVRGGLLQQVAAGGGGGGASQDIRSRGGTDSSEPGTSAGGRNGQSGSRGSSGQPSRSGTEEQRWSGSGSDTGEPLERQNSLDPNSAAVQRGLQDAGMRRREVRDGRVIVGRLKVGPGILGYGSGGTVVFEGEMDGRPVAVKRLLRQFYDLARKEIGALILSDEHPNVVRVFGLEEDHEFCYLALERCAGTLSEAMQVPALRRRFVDEAGRPTPLAVQVAEDVGRGLEALHARDIVHRDLKPHNVLLTESGRAKVSDMGLSKRLVPEQSSFESVGSGGSSGWQAPEQLVSRSGGSARQTRAVDVFSYGLLVHFCLTGGEHPFGESYERDSNILMGRMNLKHLQHLPLAADLIKGMIAAAPGGRPSVASVMCHPLWWDVHRRLAFLIDVSDRVEGEDRAEDQSLYQSLEMLLEDAVGPGGSWAAAMDSGLVNNLGKYRRYSYGSLRDLLRVIRNKHNHFRELPAELQRKVGPLPEGFLDYFTARYPGLLGTCFYFALRWCAEEPVFRKYFTPASRELLERLGPRVLRQPAQQAARPGSGDDKAAAVVQQGQQPKRPSSGGSVSAAVTAVVASEIASGEAGVAVSAQAGAQRQQAQERSRQSTVSEQQESFVAPLGNGAAAAIYSAGLSPAGAAPPSRRTSEASEAGDVSRPWAPPQQPGQWTNQGLLSAAKAERPLGGATIMTAQGQERGGGAEVADIEVWPPKVDSSMEGTSPSLPLLHQAQQAQQAQQQKGSFSPEVATGAGGQRSPGQTLTPAAGPAHERQQQPGSGLSVGSPSSPPGPLPVGSGADSPPEAAKAATSPVGPQQQQQQQRQQQQAHAGVLALPSSSVHHGAAQRPSSDGSPTAATPLTPPQPPDQLPLQQQQAAAPEDAVAALAPSPVPSTADESPPPPQQQQQQYGGPLGTPTTPVVPPDRQPSRDPSLGRIHSLAYNLPASPLVGGGSPRSLFRYSLSLEESRSGSLGPDTAARLLPAHLIEHLEKSPSLGPPLATAMQPLPPPPAGTLWPQGPSALTSSPFAPAAAAAFPGNQQQQQQQYQAGQPLPQQGQAQRGGQGLPPLPPGQQAAQQAGPRPRGPPKLEPQLPERDISPVGVVTGVDGRVALFPSRPGQPICDFFIKTGHCKFGEMCKFDHPPKFAVKLNHAGLPLRPGEPTCSFYERFGDCKFGPSCKFHHPGFAAPPNPPGLAPGRSQSQG